MARFVVQHHLATADHCDVRLEIDGVLASWAVPRGPSLDPGEHRMAVRVGDHDLDHETVENTDGTHVKQVWDRGTWSLTSTGTPTQALARGHFSFRLDGEKLHGAWTLVRLPDQQRETWLLTKKRDSAAAPGTDVLAEQPLSVLTGRSMEQIRADG